MKVSREHINAAATATYRHTVDALGRTCGSAACETVCRRLASVLDGEFAAARDADVAVACTPGCSFCCHLRVGVFPHEAIALLRYLRANVVPADAAVIEQRILDNANRIDGMTLPEHHAANIPCAFLLENRCSAHAVRPSACAHHHSLSRARCEYSYHHPHDIGTPKNGRPASLELQALGDALIEATQAGLKAAGLSNGRGELHQQLRALIEDSSLIDRWCAGGEVAGAPYIRDAGGEGAS